MARPKGSKNKNPGPPTTRHTVRLTAVEAATISDYGPTVQRALTAILAGIRHSLANGIEPLPQALGMTEFPTRARADRSAR